MLAHVHTAALRGVESFLVRVEVNLSSGLPAFTVVGQPHGAVRESRDRVTAALRNSGFPLLNRRITVNLAPGDVRKEGTAFDLPIAVGLLAAGGHLDDSLLPECAFLGEWELDGSQGPGCAPPRDPLLGLLWASRGSHYLLVHPVSVGAEQGRRSAPCWCWRAPSLGRQGPSTPSTRRVCHGLVRW